MSIVLLKILKRFEQILCNNNQLAQKHFKRPLSVTRELGNNILNAQNVNQHMRRLEYAVRGPLVIRASQIEKELQTGANKPFKSVIRANIGDCHAMNQKPITYFRQMIACAADNSLLLSPDVPKDVKTNVEEILSYCGGKSVGAYSDSCGIEIIRRHIADYIEQRDGGIKSDWTNIFLSTGASASIKSVLSLLNEDSNNKLPNGVLIPIPQYPLYSATLCEYGMTQVNYYLDEASDWRLNVDELRRAYNAERDKCNIKAIVVINPGNPTGSVMSEDNILEVLNFANEKKLVVLADEVYQHNIYDLTSKFTSFKKVLNKTNHQIELASFMSASKGFMGECGLRGGYCELTNFSDEVRAILYKTLSAWLCSSTLGQIAMDCVVRNPKPGDDSYELFETERTKVLSDLKRKAKLVADTFNSVEGVKSNTVAGAMYAFPQLDLPRRAIEKAKSLNVAPDFFYAMQFLERYGVCIVPGSGFGQKPDTYHFRTTILPPPEIFDDMMDRFKKFHTEFLAEYSN